MVMNYFQLISSGRIFLLIGVLITIAFLFIAIVSFREKEYRAFRISMLFSLLLLVSFLTIYFIDFPHKGLVVKGCLFFIAGVLVILFIPFRPKLKGGFQVPKQKHDERDVMFSRNELIPGTEKFDLYYQSNPDYKNLDDKFREKPGLLSDKSMMYHPYTYASAHANLEIIETLKPIIDGEVDNKKQDINKQEITNYIKTWAKKLGVHSIATAELKDYHVYSHKGRRDLYGKRIINNHKYAIAFTVEMDHELMKTAPKGPVIMESTQQYLNSGVIALQIAYFIRKMGFSAKAHIDGNYELICPLVARDAGLGEIGRMGLLMTPKLGPRVRIAVVTTDIPLILNKRKNYSSVIDFCGICKKCADVCPSQSISFKDREEIEGVFRWKINSEKCFTYWASAGTDCGKCMAVCPYAHPNNMMHNFIRWGIHNSYIFRRFALYMDDLFYGRRPKSVKLPSWINI